MNISGNPLTHYIHSEYAEKIAPPPEEMSSDFEATLKPVTVRMTPEQIETVDNIASYFGKSRREIMTNAIEGGISLVFDSLAQASCFHTPGFSELSEQEQDQRIELARQDFIRELCA